jgi:hypothetical protein
LVLASANFAAYSSSERGSDGGLLCLRRELLGSRRGGLLSGRGGCGLGLRSPQRAVLLDESRHGFVGHVGVLGEQVLGQLGDRVLGEQRVERRLPLLLLGRRQPLGQGLVLCEHLLQLLAQRTAVALAGAAGGGAVVEQVVEAVRHVLCTLRCARQQPPPGRGGALVLETGLHVAHAGPVDPRAGGRRGLEPRPHASRDVECGLAWPVLVVLVA